MFDRAFDQVRNAGGNVNSYVTRNGGNPMVRSIRPLLLVAMLVAMLAAPVTMFAHERRDVGKYQFVVGFISEPAFKEQQNAIDLRITNKETGQPVEEVEETLHAMVIVGSAERDLPLKPVFNQPGAYKAVFFPTSAGDYTFHFSGAIEGTPIDERFTSKPGGFSAVQEPAELHFPVTLPMAGDVQARFGAVDRGVTVATAVGALGLLVGIVSLIMPLDTLRRRKATSVTQPAGAQSS